jgi:hypothetical protein
LKANGGRGWNRTTNLSIKSRMLCQLSYASIEVKRPNVEQHSGGLAAQVPNALAKYSIISSAVSPVFTTQHAVIQNELES